MPKIKKKLPHIKEYHFNYRTMTLKEGYISQLIVTSPKWKTDKGLILQGAWAIPFVSEKKENIDLIKKELHRGFLEGFKKEVPFKVYTGIFPKNKKDLISEKLESYKIINAEEILETTKSEYK